MTSDDWFGDFVLADEEEEEEKAPSPVRLHRKGKDIDLSYTASWLYECVLPEKRASAEVFLKYLIVFMHGKRNIRKRPLHESLLSTSQRGVYHRIMDELKDPVRRERIFGFINSQEITGRLINYFVVYYALVEREMSYYLDRTRYPHRVIGEMTNNPDQPEILKRISQGENIVWLNLHQEYKNSKNKKGRRNRHAPFRRSLTVLGRDGEEYSLCELNFYLWLDEIGGFDLFYLFEEDIRQKKAQYDEEKRKLDRSRQKKRKRKVVLKKTDGKNYKSHILRCVTRVPFSILKPEKQ